MLLGIGLIVGVFYLMVCIATWNMDFGDGGQPPVNHWQASTWKKVALTPLFAVVITAGSLVNLLLLPFGKKI